MGDWVGYKLWQRIFSAPYVWFLALLVVGFVWRMQGVTQWPMPFHPMLQYENALNARAIWYQRQGEDASVEAKHWLAGYQGRAKGIGVEPLVASYYQLMGEELPWVSGVITSLVWLLTCYFIFAIARRQCRSHFAGFMAACFLLLHPFCVVVSRSFQHEAGQMLFFLGAWFLIFRDDILVVHWKNFCMALGLGVCLCFKPGIGWIPLCFVLLASGVQRHGWKKTLCSPMLYVIPVLMLIPSIVWMKYILGTDETHQWKWYLLFTADWYLNTWHNITYVMGWFPLLVTLIVTAWQVSVRRWTGLILLLGFVVYASVFNYAAMTHDYYLLSLFPIVALAWAEFGLWFLPSFKMLYHNYLRNQLVRRYSLKEQLSIRQFMPYLVGAMATYFLLHTQSNATTLLTAGPYRPHEQLFQSLGQQLGIGTSVVALTNDYAMPLRFFSGLHAQWWPTQGDLWYEALGGRRTKSAQERLALMMQQSTPRYFIVSLPVELVQQPDLVELLQQYRQVPTALSGVSIFDLEQKR